MDKYEDNLNSFLSLINDEVVIRNGKQSAEEYLLHLWRTDKNGFAYVVRGSLKYIRSSRGLDSCIINVCLSIGSGSRELLEEIALRRRTGSKWSNGFVTAAILLGSTKVMDKFRKGFEESFASGVSHHYTFKQAEALDFLRTIVFLKLACMADLVMKLAMMKNEQSHRLNKLPLEGIASRSLRKEKRLNELDYEPIKYAEASNVYLTDGAVAIKKYLEAIDNAEYRAGAYLFCLACERNLEDVDLFIHKFRLYEEQALKNMCIEAIVYVGEPDQSANFLNEELEKYDFDNLAKRRGYDWKIITFRAHPPLFYSLLNACYYIKTLNKGLMDKIKALAEAKEAGTSTPATMILKKHGIAVSNKSIIDNTQQILFETLPSPSHLLSMAKQSGRL